MTRLRRADCSGPGIVRRRAGRLAGEGWIGSLAHGAAVGVVGGALIALKALLH